MGQYSSYYLYQKYEKRGNGNWIPSYPNTFSVDGDGTMTVVEKSSADTACGYIPSGQTQYRWVNMNISTDWICDECPTYQYRWINLDPSIYYYCSGTTKYYKQQKQVSYDGGQTWTDVSPAEYQMGNSYQTQSTDCGYIEPQYRTTSGTPYCSGYDKYQDVYSQVSYDSGSTWTTTATTPTLIEPNSQDCGYVPFDGKFKATYSGGTTYSAGCDSSTELTTATTRAAASVLSMTSAEIGDCVTIIGDGAFQDCFSLTSVTIPNSVTYIGYKAFYQCFSLTSVTIPSGVTSIVGAAFYDSVSLTSITVEATTPPTMRGAFDYTNNCPIYVPCDSVDTYKATSGWYSYADRIRPIQPCTPTGDTKLVASYSDGQVRFRYCDSSTELTSATTKPSGYIYTAMTSAEIGDCVTSIGTGAFEDCYSLTSVTIGSGITTIGSEAFYYCTSLTSITINAVTPPTVAGNTFSNTNGCPIYVPSDSVNTYKSASGWSNYASRIQAITT